MLSLNNIEVMYSGIILAVKGITVAVPGDSVSPCWVRMARARAPP